MGVAQGEQNCLIFEYYSEGDFRALLDQNLPWHDRVLLATQIASALDYMHHPFNLPAMVHMDVKSANILVRGNHAVLADFDCAQSLQHVTGDSQKYFLGSPGLYFLQNFC